MTIDVQASRTLSLRVPRALYDWLVAVQAELKQERGLTVPLAEVTRMLLGDAKRQDEVSKKVESLMADAETKKKKEKRA